MPRGSGSCTRMPSTAGSALSRATSASSAASVVPAGRRIVCGGDPGGRGRAVLGAHIDGAGRIVADQHDGQARAERQRGDPRRERRAQRRGDRLAVDQPGGHSAASLVAIAAASPLTRSVLRREAAPAATSTCDGGTADGGGQRGAGGPVGAAVLGRFAHADRAAARPSASGTRPCSPGGARAAAPSPPPRRRRRSTRQNIVRRPAAARCRR